MNAPLPKSTRDALIVTARAMLAPFRPQGDIDRAVDAMLAALESDEAAASTSQPQTDRVLSAREVAEILHRSTKTVRSLARRGLIRRVHMGTGRRASGYSAKSLDMFLAGANGNANAEG